MEGGSVYITGLKQCLKAKQAEFQIQNRTELWVQNYREYKREGWQDGRVV